jgi:hypothetical protein
MKKNLQETTCLCSRAPIALWYEGLKLLKSFSLHKIRPAGKLVEADATVTAIPGICSPLPF